ncbi:MAG: hypothetical protein K1X29_09655 [Bdellovibrionales bacterium]|nr:hypothetical protein [Bdellovibrionales bacterium]
MIRSFFVFLIVTIATTPKFSFADGVIPNYEALLAASGLSQALNSPSLRNYALRALSNHNLDQHFDQGMPRPLFAPMPPERSPGPTCRALLSSLGFGNRKTDSEDPRKPRYVSGPTRLMSDFDVVDPNNTPLARSIVDAYATLLRSLDAKMYGEVMTLGAFDLFISDAAPPEALYKEVQAFVRRALAADWRLARSGVIEQFFHPSVQGSIQAFLSQLSGPNRVDLASYFDQNIKMPPGRLSAVLDAEFQIEQYRQSNPIVPDGIDVDLWVDPMSGVEGWEDLSSLKTYQARLGQVKEGKIKVRLKDGLLMPETLALMVDFSSFFTTKHRGGNAHNLSYSIHTIPVPLIGQASRKEVIAATALALMEFRHHVESPSTPGPLLWDFAAELLGLKHLINLLLESNLSTKREVLLQANQLAKIDIRGYDVAIGTLVAARLAIFEYINANLFSFREKIPGVRTLTTPEPDVLLTTQQLLTFIVKYIKPDNAAESYQTLVTLITTVGRQIRVTQEIAKQEHLRRLALEDIQRQTEYLQRRQQADARAEIASWVRDHEQEIQERRRLLEARPQRPPTTTHPSPQHAVVVVEGVTLPIDEELPPQEIGDPAADDGGGGQVEADD